MEKTNTVPRPCDALPAGTRIGGYTLSRKISEGGMGEVYEGVQRALKRRVAVKLLATWATGRADLRARFLREGETAARIRHHNIVEIYDVGVWGERPYIVMEFLDGRTLEEVMQLEGSLLEAEAVDLMLPVLSAIGAANDRGIIHRDIKPENVFIADMDSGVEPKVLDFGISRVVTSHERSIETRNVGTPHYMSPEQARGESVDGRSDQYSIAIVLYEMVTGHLPRDHEVVSTLMRMVAHEGFTHPREHAPMLSDTIVNVLMRALSAHPSERFDDLQDMMRALLPVASTRARNYWEGELSTALDPGRVMERPPPSGSHRAVVGGVAAIDEELEALPGEETQSEIVVSAPSEGQANASPQDTLAPPSEAPRIATTASASEERAPAKEQKKRTPWLLLALVAIALLIVGGWFATNASSPPLGAIRTPQPPGESQDSVPAQEASQVASPAPAAPSDTDGEAEGMEVNGLDEGELSAADEEATPPNEVVADIANEERPASPAPRSTRTERQAQAMRARMQADTAPPVAREPAPEAETEATMMSANSMNPSWAPTGSSDNVDPWN